MLSHYPAIDALLLALLLSHLGVKGADLDCTSDDVVCIDKSPDFVLKWQISEANKTAINIAGKPASYSLSGSDVWLAFGFSPSGTMNQAKIFACQKTGSDYVTKRVDGYSHGLNSGSTEVSQDMVGTYVDGVVTCKYNLAHSALFTEKYKMIYGMGAMSGSTMQRHSKTPSRTTEEFTMVTGTTDDTSTTNDTTNDDGNTHGDDHTHGSGSSGASLSMLFILMVFLGALM